MLQSADFMLTKLVPEEISAKPMNEVTKALILIYSWLTGRNKILGDIALNTSIGSSPYRLLLQATNMIVKSENPTNTLEELKQELHKLLRNIVDTDIYAANLRTIVLSTVLLQSLMHLLKFSKVEVIDNDIRTEMIQSLGTHTRFKDLHRLAVMTNQLFNSSQASSLEDLIEDLQVEGAAELIIWSIVRVSPSFDKDLLTTLSLRKLRYVKKLSDKVNLVTVGDELFRPSVRLMETVYYNAIVLVFLQYNESIGLDKFESIEHLAKINERDPLVLMLKNERKEALSFRLPIWKGGSHTFTLLGALILTMVYWILYTIFVGLYLLKQSPTIVVPAFYSLTAGLILEFGVFVWAAWKKTRGLKG